MAIRDPVRFFCPDRSRFRYLLTAAGKGASISLQWHRITGAILLLLVLGGCVSPIDGGRGFAPFFETYPAAPGASRWVIRPLIMHESGAEKSHSSLLWPLAMTEREGDRRTSWLLPVFYDSRHPTADTGNGPGTDWDGFLLPFFYGNDPDEGSYFMCFPLGGSWKGIFAQDRIDMFLFPLYMRLRDRERISHHFLFPFLNTLHGPYHDGFRIWPFYGRYRGTTRASALHPEPVPKYDRSFVLWPFYHSHDNDLDSEHPARGRWLFPFYGRIESRNIRRDSVLWPLYGRVRDSKQERITNYSFLLGWNVTRSPALTRTDFWPFFGVLESENLYRQFALFPIQRTTHWKKRDRQGTSHWVLPFYVRHLTEDHREGTYRTHTRCWPFFVRNRYENGVTETFAPELLPLRSPERIEHLYARIWRLYRAVDREADGSHAWELLWGAVRRERNPQRSWFSLLGGMFGWDQEAGRTRWRLLYIPF